MSEKRRIVVNTLANGTAQFASMLSALIFMPFLIKGFGTVDYGLYLLVSSISGYSGLLDLGVGASVVKMTAESSARGDARETGRIVSSAVAFFTLVGIVSALVMLALGANAGSWFRVTSDGARLLTNLFLVAAVWSLWSWPSGTAGAVLAGFQRYTQSAMVALATVLGNVAVTIAVLMTGQGPLALIVGNYAVSLLTGLVQLWLARRALGGTPLSFRLVDRSSFKSIFSFAWAVFVIQICTVILYQQTDRLILGIFIGAAAVALYEAAGKFQGLVSQLTTFTVSAVMPMASQLGAEGRQESLRQLFLRGTKYSLMLLSPVVIVLVVVAKPLLNEWLGPAFAAQSVAAQLLISHQLLTGGTAVGDSMIIGLGQLPKRVPYVVVVALLNLSISLLLVQRLGILGVVIGTTVPWLIDFPFHMRVILRALDVTPGRWVKETVLPTYPLLLLPAGISALLVGTTLGDSILGVGMIGIVSVAAYWLAVYALAFQPHEREDVRAGIRAAWGRATGRA